jgi:hypothetical protein
MEAWRDMEKIPVCRQPSSSLGRPERGSPQPVLRETIDWMHHDGGVVEGKLSQGRWLLAVPWELEELMEFARQVFSCTLISYYVYDPIVASIGLFS